MTNEQFCNISKGKHLFIVCEGSAKGNRGFDYVTKRVHAAYDADCKAEAIYFKKYLTKTSGIDHCVREYKDGVFYDCY